LRARRAGLGILYVPEAVVVHRVEERGRRAEGEPWRLRLATANLLRVLRRHASALDWLTAAPYFLARWVGWLTVRSIVRADGASPRAVSSGPRDYARSPLRASLPGDDR